MLTALKTHVNIQIMLFFFQSTLHVCKMKERGLIQMLYNNSVLFLMLAVLLEPIDELKIPTAALVLYDMCHIYFISEYFSRWKPPIVFLCSAQMSAFLIPYGI